MAQDNLLYAQGPQEGTGLGWTHLLRTSTPPQSQNAVLRPPRQRWANAYISRVEKDAHSGAGSWLYSSLTFVLKYYERQHCGLTESIFHFLFPNEWMFAAQKRGCRNEWAGLRAMSPMWVVWVASPGVGTEELTEQVREENLKDKQGEDFFFLTQLIMTVEVSGIPTGQLYGQDMGKWQLSWQQCLLEKISSRLG